jgi:L-rhamnonate dehydratase
MRITSVRAVQPRTPQDPKDWRTTVGQILVVVDTDKGVRGFGVGGGGAAGIHVVENVLRDMVMREDPADVERLWEEMYRATEPYGRKGLVIMALSGLDNALWDAWGKAEGKSVAQLLGGPQTDYIPCYATNPPPVEAVRLGFRAVKVHFTRPATEDEAIERMAAVRAAIGPEVQLFSDTHGNWDFEGTLRLAEAFAELGVGWMEEPLPEMDLELYGELCRRSPVPIAGGEHEYTVRGFRELARHKAHKVWQPDATWTGGMTQMKAVYALGRQEGVRVCPHRGAEVWGLHAIAALDPQPLAESPRPWITWLRGQPPIEDGYVRLPPGPGFGVDVAPDLLGF